MWLLAATLGSGCQLGGVIRPNGPGACPPMIADDVPRELRKGILPTYTIEPPDILTIDAIHVLPKPPYQLRSLDVIGVQVAGALTEEPIEGAYPIELGGTINLGPSYGAISIAGLTVEEARGAIQEHLAGHLKDPEANVTLLDIAAKQQIAGQHLVGPDGTVTLGSYGSVSVVGLTIAEAKRAIETHLLQYLEEPEVSVDVFAYNSRVYYVITQGAGLGDGVYRFPVTGNETVLDAISQINGLEQVSSKKIWIARPGCGPNVNQLLLVDWNAITECGNVETNYQVLPGDRVFIAEDELIAFDTRLGKIIAPLERLMGFTLMGAGTATRLSGPILRGGGNRQASF